ncbi:putative mannose 6-phosphate receptor-like protein C530.09c [Aspergillus lentulus]|uniref:Mannose 6-phosphate receptor-like protein C530.09c n=1 Tax=Aspergillus lentulus TaxID=293939 RepID=A0ABQ0ZY81_ASPLE|nr:putative mannose 6-phosphate receptor-like protein C530.09c [Aspergillus lentulus]GFF30729.1 putative mannose 6-phosphate receptor-like protein C530.09c [Aspergillus lentulus]GFF68984.1 putative mannose 6-phosphate receptor-like protein C530.09c [Aspergillus lentulus]GFF68998.1 putative mannose 6-phosphate receptor-like protein C530.09c [Aspergillus lentulus]GFG04476.1 putative mannose 6-phosphate receptor-like protein C530.09c [Aspergillus lentulus]
MKSLAGSFLGLLFLLSAPVTSVYAASEPTGKKDGLSPCVARSPSTGLYYDLNAISVSRPDPSDSKKSSKNAPKESWHAKGHDYHANFTLNICAPVIEDIKDVVGVERDRWKNISAYYEKEGKIYSIGEQATQPFFRGRKLVLNYTNGSPCPGERIGHSSRNKSTIMSFLCDRDALSHQAIASFVGTMDQCTYFFEVRSSAACGSIGHANGEGLGPAGVFGVIALIAVAAYLVGGCAYQRTVMHQRGWRQCPNYSLWAGIFDFVKDMFVILFSSLGRLFRVRRSPTLGHGRANGSSGGFIGAIGGRRGRDNYASDVDAENRLIDQLDETWDD